MVVIWNNRGKSIKLHVIGVYENNSETWLTVCKLGADPIMGRFGVRAADTSGIDLLEVEKADRFR